MEIYCRFTIINYTTQSFLSLKCVYIFLVDPVYIKTANGLIYATELTLPLHTLFTKCPVVSQNRQKCHFTYVN